MASDPKPSSDPPSRGKVAGNLTQLGKYRISRRLGVGGMGTVYLATDTELKREVALKVLPSDRAANPILVRRFKSEGQAAALLKHENIVSVYEAGQSDGYLFLALEYVEGMDVLQWMHRKGTVSVKRSVEIVRQVALALQHAFERNIVHRDIKPSNLMITSAGLVKLTDMGLARSVDDTLDTNITRDGTTVGTVDYMAPEQASNSKSADIRSDIYSLGCTWYHMLTGLPPYPEGSVTNKLSAHASSPLPDPRLLNPRIPEAVVAVIHQMMAKTKEARYQTPRDLLADLAKEQFLRAGQPTNLLAAFGDEEDDTTDLNSEEGLREIGSSAVFSFSEDSVDAQPRSNAAPRRQVAPTRAEIPVKKGNRTLDQRDLLPRMGGQRGSRPATVVPWKFLFLLGLILAIAIAIWAFINS